MRLVLLPAALLLLLCSFALSHDQQQAEDPAVFHGGDPADGDSIVSVETLRPEDDIVYLTPDAHPDVFFAEHFDSEEAFGRRWIKSQAKKDGAEAAIAKYDGEWQLEQQQKDPLAGELKPTAIISVVYEISVHSKPSIDALSSVSWTGGFRYSQNYQFGLVVTFDLVNFLLSRALIFQVTTVLS